jgi:CRISPR/Cas system CSM-associated protein Csm3 (group 7 of RAMP superfamily)
VAEEQFLLAVHVALQTSLHIAGPGRTLPLVDRSVDVDEAGIPFIPASSFRGRLRAHVERLLKAFGELVCCAPRPEHMCPHVGLDIDFCRVCRIFGSAWRLSATTFTDLTPPEEQREALKHNALVKPTFSLRTGISINRRLNTAEQQRLFVMETVPDKFNSQGLCFEGSIEGWLERDDLGWLLAGLRTITHLGGGKARGMGRVRVSIATFESFDKTTQQWKRDDWEVMLEEAMQHDTP